MKGILTGCLVIVIILISCAKNTTNSFDFGCSADYDSCSLKAPGSEIDSVEAYLASLNITDAIKHCSGMYYKIDSIGTGKTATACSVVTASYIGLLKDNTVFQPQVTSNSLPIGRLITGFKNGVLLIKEGGGVTLYVPPALAYGNQQVGSAIPPNSMLIFHINLVSVQ